jgi:UDP-2,3-diacylglucosamine pyrophosphatase LpxH
MLEKTRYRTIVISDIHLGSKDCNAKLLNNFLDNHECDFLYLNGDIIDAWKIEQNKWHWKQKHSAVIRKLLLFPKKGTKVVYIIGNHDEFLRMFLPNKVNFDKIELVNSYSHTGLNGKKYLITHGDLFDTVTRLHRWVSFLGDRAYSLLVKSNGIVNYIRRLFKLNYWSLSKFLKTKVKKAVDFICHFEETLSNYAKKKNYDGVICGHIHVAEIKNIYGIEYMNSGDWVESCTALVETETGEWKIIYWQEKVQHENIDSN